MNITIIDGEYHIDFNGELYTQRIEQGPNSWPLGAAERVIIALCERVEKLSSYDDIKYEHKQVPLAGQCERCGGSGSINESVPRPGYMNWIKKPCPECNETPKDSGVRCECGDITFSSSGRCALCR